MQTTVSRIGYVFLAVACLGLAGCRRDPAEPPAPAGLEPLAGSKASVTAAPPPSDVIVLNAADAADVSAPFVRRAQGGGTLALALPEGAASADRSGKARFQFEAPAAGVYYGWARVRWGDSCSNSLACSLNNAPARTVGEDHVYNSWHWVRAGIFELNAGANSVAIGEREDGVSLDQICFTRTKDFTPVGPFGGSGGGVELRRFADSFDRSPGHGMEAWQLLAGEWKIAFSFDPNRIPNQYALTGRSADAEAVALVGGAPWQGCRLSFALFPEKVGSFGAVLDYDAETASGRRVAFHVADDGATLTAGKGGSPIQLDGQVRLGQWHRIDILRWGWTMSIAIDGKRVWTTNSLPPPDGRVGLLVESGTAVFDDLEVERLPWLADDGKELTIPWQVDAGAQWYRPSDGQARAALIGRGGAIRASWEGLRVEEWLLAQDGAAPQLRTSGADESQALVLSADTGEINVLRVAARFGRAVGKDFRLGPYHFTKPRLYDPSDYLDFTTEEYAHIEGSEHARKLRRKARMMPVLGGGGAKSAWGIRRGRWQLLDGVLTGSGPDAKLAHSRELIGPFALQFKLRLTNRRSRAAVELYAMPEVPVVVPLGPEQGVTGREWREVRIEAGANDVKTMVAGKLVDQRPRAPGLGGRMSLRIPQGTVEFDDIEFLVPRRTEASRYYAFDQRETGWWRAGNWVDHGGIACILASSWVSLVAPQGEGLMWHKDTVGRDFAVAFSVEENSQWHGWGEGHTHFAYDNLTVVLADKPGSEAAYRLVVNANQRQHTILYRGAKELVRVPQDEYFPIRYHGGHAPYGPRKSRIVFARRGDALIAVINGREVLRHRDPQPLAANHLALGGFQTRVNFSNIEMVELEAE